MGIFGNDDEASTVAQPVTVKDKPLTCAHCGNDTFYSRKVALLFINDIMNSKVPCFVCSSCTHMHMFAG